MLTYQFVSATPGQQEGGILDLPDADLNVALYYAAFLYCQANPSAENGARLQGYAATLPGMLKQALRRHLRPVEQQMPGMAPRVMRNGAAR